MINVSIAASFAPKVFAVVLALHGFFSDTCCIAMAERNDPEETRRRVEAERVRLQAIAKRNTEAAKEKGASQTGGRFGG